MAELTLSVLHKSTQRDYLARVNDPDFPKAKAAELAKKFSKTTGMEIVEFATEVIGTLKGVGRKSLVLLLSIIRFPPNLRFWTLDVARVSFFTTSLRLFLMPKYSVLTFQIMLSLILSQRFVTDCKLVMPLICPGKITLSTW